MWHRVTFPDEPESGVPLSLSVYLAPTSSAYSGRRVRPARRHDDNRAVLIDCLSHPTHDTASSPWGRVLAVFSATKYSALLRHRQTATELSSKTQLSRRGSPGLCRREYPGPNWRSLLSFLGPKLTLICSTLMLFQSRLCSIVVYLSFFFSLRLPRCH